MTKMKGMKNIPIKEGFYVIEEDVENPRADRRVKNNFWKRKTFPAGQKIEVIMDGSPISVGPIDSRLIYLHAVGHRSHNRILIAWQHTLEGEVSYDYADGEEVFKALKPALKPVTLETFDDVWAAQRRDVEAGRVVLKYLVQQDRLELGELKDLLARAQGYELHEAVGEGDD